MKIPFTCPACKSDEIEGESISVFTYPYDSNKYQYAEQECSCMACDTEWTDIYKLETVKITGVPEEYEYLLDNTGQEGEEDV